MSRRAAAIGLGVAITLGMSGTASASFVLKPGQTRQYRCDGWNACIKRAADLHGRHLKRIAPGCWSHPWTFGESCTMSTDCRMPRGVPTCWAHNGSRVRLRVWR